MCWAKCWSTSLFQTLATKSVYLGSPACFTAAVYTCIKKGHLDYALSVYEDIKKDGVKPNEVSQLSSQTSENILRWVWDLDVMVEILFRVLCFGPLVRCFFEVNLKYSLDGTYNRIGERMICWSTRDEFHCGQVFFNNTQVLLSIQLMLFNHALHNNYQPWNFLSKVMQYCIV